MYSPTLCSTWSGQRLLKVLPLDGLESNWFVRKCWKVTVGDVPKYYRTPFFMPEFLIFTNHKRLQVVSRENLQRQNSYDWPTLADPHGVLMGAVGLELFPGHCPNLSPSWSSNGPWHSSSRPSVASKRKRLTPKKNWVGWRTDMCWRAEELSVFLIIPYQTCRLYFMQTCWWLPSKLMDFAIHIGFCGSCF